MKYEREAKSQAKKNHIIYEKRWRDKSRQTKKELNGLKKNLKRTEKNIKNLVKQKAQKENELLQGLDGEIKLARQPLLDLEVAERLKRRRLSGKLRGYLTKKNL